MPPKKAPAPSKKTEQKKKEKVIEVESGFCLSYLTKNSQISTCFPHVPTYLHIEIFNLCLVYNRYTLSNKI